MHTKNEWEGKRDFHGARSEVLRLDEDMMGWDGSDGLANVLLTAMEPWSI
jgi:hypothetical protein